MITTYKNVVFLAAATIALSACAGFELDKARSMQPSGTAFEEHLYKEYVELSTSEYDESDFRDSDAFAERAIAAVGGNASQPEEVAARNLTFERVGTLTRSRERLVAALTDAAKQKIPDQTARAQAMFDCWMQEQEENFQPEDIARCQAGFIEAMAKVDEAMKPVPVAAAAPAPKPAPLPSLPKPLVVYFNLGSFDLDDKSLAKIKGAAIGAKDAKVSIFTLSGHADRVGSSGYNKGLSRARVNAVGNALMEAGIARKLVVKDSFGEDRPQVATPDGQAESLNRRVEITFSR